MKVLQAQLSSHPGSSPVDRARPSAAFRPPAYGVGPVDAATVQRMAEPSASQAGVHAAARLGTSGSGAPLPHRAAIQRAFGKHDVSTIVAHTDAAAARGAAAMGALAFASGERVGFGVRPDLRLAAHEAAHVVQQRAGVQLSGGVGRAGDPHERTADAVAERVVAGRSAEDLLEGPTPGRAASAPVVQRYSVLAADHIYAAEPASRPWFGYPYAVATGATLPAQTQREGVGGTHEFLDAEGSNTAWITTAADGFGLRVSNDYQMAVEDSDLTRRQPKAFFASTTVIGASNEALEAAHSSFRLVGDGGTTMTILTGWYGQTTLRRVTPRYNDGSADNAPQNCNAIAAKVSGGEAAALGNDGGFAALAVAKRLAPTAARNYLAWFRNASDPREEAEVLNPIAEEYAHNQDQEALSELHANRYANPGVGESFMIGSIGSGERLDNGKSRVRDYESGEDRDLGWPYHFGGVVAQSGTDRITLENYARGDDRTDNPDPRWYFQMYGESVGQSFHEFHKAKQEYANPVTVGVRRR